MLTQFRLNEIQKEFLKFKSPDEPKSMISGLQKIMDDSGYEDFKEQYMKQQIHISQMEVANIPNSFSYNLMKKNIPVKSIIIEEDRISFKNGKCSDEQYWRNILHEFFNIPKDDPREVLLMDYDKQIWSSRN